VLAVLTGADYLRDGPEIPHRPFSTSPPERQPAKRDGSPIFIARIIR